MRGDALFAPDSTQAKLIWDNLVLQACVEGLLGHPTSDEGRVFRVPDGASMQRYSCIYCPCCLPSHSCWAYELVAKTRMKGLTFGDTTGCVECTARYHTEPCGPGNAIEPESALTTRRIEHQAHRGSTRRCKQEGRVHTRICVYTSRYPRTLPMLLEYM